MSVRPDDGSRVPASADETAYSGPLRNGAGRAALICGVLALLCTIFFFLIITVPVALLLGLAGLMLGVLGRSRVRRGMATNRGSATFGLVTGLLSLLILGGLAAGGVALLTRHKSDVTDFSTCTRQAGTDPHKLQDCQNRFRSSVTP